MARSKITFEDILRWFALSGAVALVGSCLVAAFGFATGVLVPEYSGTLLRFLIAVLVVTAPYAELIERREQRLRRMSLEERLGFVPHAAQGR
jgi:hypothetical protein